MEEYAEALVKISSARKGSIVPFQGEKGDGTMVTFAWRDSLDARLGLDLDATEAPRATLLVRSGPAPWGSMTRSGTSFGFRMKHDPPAGVLETVKGKLERGRFEVDENRPGWFVAESNQAQDLQDLWPVPVKRQLVPLLEFPGIDSLSITFTPHLFRARFVRPPSGSASLAELLRATLALLEALLDGDHGRLVRYIKAATSSYKAALSWCGACGEALETSKVICASCLLPQHPDCWTTLDRCAAPGCASKETLAQE